jgi:hypothetical protein
VSKIRDYHAALGRILVVWAELEVSIQLLVLTVRNMRPPEDRWRASHQLGSELIFLREEMDELPSLAARRDTVKQLLDEIGSLAKTRHNYVHGATLKDRIGNRDIVAPMPRLSQPRGRPRRLTIETRTSQIEDNADVAFQLGDRTLDLVEVIHEEQAAR